MKPPPNKSSCDWVSPNTLQPWARNPKDHSAENTNDLARSIVRFGFTDPIEVWRSKQQIVSGHGRLMAVNLLLAEDPGRVLAIDAPEPGLVLVRWLEFASQDEADAYALAANRHNERNPMNAEKVAEIFADFEERGVSLEGIGYTDEEREAMLGGEEEGAGGEGEGDPDADAPEPPAVPVSKLGEVYELGPHRLVCGDCRASGVVSSLLGGRKINLAFTSPPYASQREYDVSSGFKPIPADEYVEWFDAVQSSVRASLAPDGSWFVNIKAASTGIDTELYVLDLVLAHVRRWGWHFAAEFCWERGGIPGKPARRFKNQFEPVYQFALNDWKFRPEEVMHQSRAAFGYEVGKRKSLEDHQGGVGEEWFSGRAGEGLAYPGNRLGPMSGGHEATGHSAAFPPGLPEFFVKAYTDKGDTVFDPFMGSGTTLIAAAKHGRVAFGTEISPAYCDVIRRRWTTYAKSAGIDPGPGALEAG